MALRVPYQSIRFSNGLIRIPDDPTMLSKGPMKLSNSLMCLSEYPSKLSNALIRIEMALSCSRRSYYQGIRLSNGLRVP